MHIQMRVLGYRQGCGRRYTAQSRAVRERPLGIDNGYSEHSKSEGFKLRP